MKMPFPSIVAIALLQSNTFCTLSTDNKDVMEKKMEDKPTENPILLLTMSYTKK